MGAALDDLIDLLELEQLEVNLFRGLSPDEDRQRVFGGQVAGAGAHRGGPHRRPGPRALAARVLPAARRPAHPDHLRRRPHPRRPELHDPARRRDPARPRDLQPVGVVPRGRARSRAPVHDAGRARSRDAADVPGAARAVRRSVPAGLRRLDPARAPDRPALDRAAALAQPGADRPRARAARVVPRQRQAARRRAAARVHRGVRVRPHVARHRGDGARAARGTTTAS